MPAVDNSLRSDSCPRLLLFTAGTFGGATSGQLHEINGDHGAYGVPLPTTAPGATCA